MDDEDDLGGLVQAPNDWMEHPEQLPDRPESLIERFKLFFALDVRGLKGHDMYIGMLPNQVCIVGLAPSHPLIRQHRAAQCSSGQQAAAGSSLESPAVLLPLLGSGGGEGRDCTRKSAENSAAVEEALPAAASEPLTGVGGSEQDPPTGPLVGFKRGREGGGGARHELARVDSFPVAQLKVVNFEVSGRGSRLSIKESGRSGKKASGSGTMLHPDSCLCRVESSQGQCVVVSAATPGKLLEVNSRLVTDGTLLFNREGYLAILYKSRAEVEEAQRVLTPLSDYLELRGLSLEDLR